MDITSSLITLIIILMIVYLTYNYLYKPKKSNQKLHEQKLELSHVELLKIKREKLEDLRRNIHLNIEGEYAPETRVFFPTSEIKDAHILLMGAAAGSALGGAHSYYDLHQTFSDNEDFIKTMEDRYNNKFLEADYNTWLQQLKLLNEFNGVQQNYVSNYAGYKAESLTQEKLESLGYQVTPFESRNHPNDDLQAVTPEGEEINISVKSYSSIESLKNAVKNHPDSTHYAINDELYKEIQGDINLQNWFQSRNVDIIDGGYSNEFLRKSAEKSISAFKGMQESVQGEVLEGLSESLLDSIPFSSLIIFARNQYKHNNAFKNGSQSESEYKINKVSDQAGFAGRIGVSLFSAKIGAAAGTIFGPPGTAIGGVAGGVVGALGVTTAVSKAKDSFKWGEIYKAQLMTSNLYSKDLFNEPTEEWIRNYVLKINESQLKLKQLQQQEFKYKEELNAYSIVMPSIEAVIWEQSMKDLDKYLQNIDEMQEIVQQKIEDEFYSWYEEAAELMNKKTRKFWSERILGEWVLRQATFNNFPLDSAISDLGEKYKIQIEKNPHYITQFSFDPVSNIRAIAIAEQLETSNMVVQSPMFNLSNERNAV